jgi:hypothetical protein
MQKGNKSAIAEFIPTATLVPMSSTRLRESEIQEEAKLWRERLTPLEQRVRKLVADIPPEVAAEGISMASLQDQLKGRWRGKAPAGLIGTCLRKLGWRRARYWRGDDIGFRATWHLPLTGKEQS